MPTRRKKSTDCPKDGPCPRGFDVQLEKAKGRVNHLDSLLPGIAADVKTISAQVNLMEVHLVTLPTWENVKELHAAVKSEVKDIATKLSVLEEAGQQVKGGWKVLTVVGGMSGTVVAIISWILNTFPHKPL